MTGDPLPVQIARRLGWTAIQREGNLWFGVHPATGQECCMPPFTTWQDVGLLIETARAKGYQITIGPFHRDLWQAQLERGPDGLGCFVAGTAAEAVGLAFVGALGKETQDNG